MNRLRSTLRLRLAVRFMGIYLAMLVLSCATAAAQWPDFYTCDAGAEDCKLWEPSVRQLIYAPADSKCWCYVTYQQRECNGVTEFRVLSVEPVDYNDVECDGFRRAFETSGNPLRILDQKRLFQEAMGTITSVIAEQQWIAANRPPGNPAAVARMRCPNGYVAVRGVSSYCMSTDVHVSQPNNAWYKITDSLVYVDEQGRIHRVYFFRGNRSADLLSNPMPPTIVQGDLGSVNINTLPRDASGFRIAPDGTRLVDVPNYQLTFTPCSGAVCCKRETHICYENGYQQRVVQRFTIAPTNPPNTCQDAANENCTPWCEESTSIDAFSHASP